MFMLPSAGWAQAGGAAVPTGPLPKFSRTSRNPNTALSENDRRATASNTNTTLKANGPAVLVGKYYGEVEKLVGVANGNDIVGCGVRTGTTAPGNINNSAGFGGSGVVRVNSITLASSLPNWAAGDIVGVALDLDNGTINWRINGGAWLNGYDPTLGTGFAFTPSAAQVMAVQLAASGRSMRINQDLTYPPPTGFLPWPFGEVETTWDPTSEASGFTTFNALDQQISTTASNDRNSKGRGTKNSGKWFLTFSPGGDLISGTFGCGIATAVVASADNLSSTPGAVCYYCNSGSAAVYSHGVQLGAVVAVNAGVLHLFIDFDAQKLWLYQTQSGGWLSSTGGQGGDPNTGGAGFAFSNTGMFRPTAQVRADAGPAVSMNLSPFAQGALPTIPPDFKYWNDN